MIKDDMPAHLSGFFYTPVSGAYHPGDTKHRFVKEDTMSRKVQITTLSAALIAMLGVAPLTGCSDTNSTGAVPQSQAEEHNHDHDHEGHDHAEGDRTPDVYTGIRGEITQLPDPSVPGSAFKVRHEQIRDFKTMDGTISVTKEGIAGMRSMTMPFPIGQGVSIDGLNVGDKVSFDFVVNWGNDRPAWEITRVELLPAETELDFTNVIEEQIDDVMDGAGEMMDHGDHDHDHGP